MASEVFVKVSGVGTYLWRAVDEDGDVLKILVHRAPGQGRRPVL
jgi:transposase-like protein